MNGAAAQPLLIDGPLTIASVGRHLADGRARAAAGDLRVDLSGVTEADSAALALVLDWLRAAHAAGTRLTVTGLPDGLRSLADLYGVDTLLPLES